MQEGLDLPSEHEERHEPPGGLLPLWLCLSWAYWQVLTVLPGL